MERNIIFHGNYFIGFYLEQSTRVQEKIEYVFKIIKLVDRVPEKFLKHIEGPAGASMPPSHVRSVLVPEA